MHNELRKVSEIENYLFHGNYMLKHTFEYFFLNFIEFVAIIKNFNYRNS